MTISNTRFLVYFCLPLFFFAFLDVAEAAVRTWDGGGGTNSWSNAANWSADTIPTAADDVVFDATSTKNSTIDAGFAGSVGSITINPGYTGTITTSRTLTVTQSSGGSGNVTISAGTWNAGTQTINVEGNWLKTAGTFNPGSSGTVNFNGAAGTQIVDAGGQSFRNWQHSGASTVQVNSALTVDNQFNHSIGTFNLNGQNLTVNGTSNLSGGTLNLSSGTVSLASILTINGATFNADSSNLTINTLSFSSGTLVATSGTFNVNGNWVRTGGTFTPGLGTVNFTGVNQNVNGGGAAFYNLVHNGTGTLTMTGNLTVDGALTNQGGDFNANTRLLVVNGPASFDAGNYSSSTASQTFNGGLDINGATWNGSSGLIVVNGNFNANSTVNAPTSFFTVSGDFIVAPGVYLPAATGIVRMSGAGAQSLQLNGNDLRDLYNIGSGTVTVTGSDINVLGIFRNNSGTFDMNGQTMTVAGLATIDGGIYNPGINVNNFNGGLTVSGGFFNGAAGAVNIVGNLTVSWGTFQASATTTTLSGNLLKTLGTFNANSGDFVLNGIAQSIVGDVTFNNLQKVVLLADTLTFGAGSTVVVTGVADLQGTVGNLLTLNTDAPGTQVSFDPRGTRTIQYVDVVDNNNINAGPILCLVGCVDSGNNLKWAFATVSFSSATAGVLETGGTFDFPIVLSAPMPAAVTVDYKVNLAVSTAKGGGVDYLLADGTATFNAGSLVPAVPVRVSIIDDAISEGNETISLDLSNPSNGIALGGTTSFVLTILDNEPPPPPASAGGAGGQFVCLAYHADSFVVSLEEKQSTGGRLSMVFVFDLPADVQKVAISANPDFNDASFVAYADRMTFQPANGLQPDKVYFRFRSNYGCSKDVIFDLRTQSVSTEESKPAEKQVETNLPVTVQKKVFDPGKVMQDYVTTEVVPEMLICPFFTKSLRFGSEDYEAVSAMQSFLLKWGFLEGQYQLGGFDEPTLQAVKRFQAYYWEEILAPWGIRTPTGYWHTTSKKMANKLIGC